MIDLYAIYTRAYDTEFRESGGRAGRHCIRAGVDAVAEASRRDALKDAAATLRAMIDTETENPLYSK